MMRFLTGNHKSVPANSTEMDAKAAYPLCLRFVTIR